MDSRIEQLLDDLETPLADREELRQAIESMSTEARSRDQHPSAHKRGDV